MLCHFSEFTIMQVIEMCKELKCHLRTCGIFSYFIPVLARTCKHHVTYVLLSDTEDRGIYGVVDVSSAECCD